MLAAYDRLQCESAVVRSDVGLSAVNPTIRSIDYLVKGIVGTV
jgi:hypothetical protein